MVRTRIPPSPTGNDLHIGNLYSALINWAFAHKHNGQFIVRIEDTDRTRFVQGAAEQILATLRAYDLEPDEDMIKGGPYGPYIQSQRLDLYKKYAQQLISQGDAYYCFCSEERLGQLRELAKAEKRQPKYDRHCLKMSASDIQDKLNENAPHVIRLRIPEGSTTYKDTIRGEITIDNATLDDQVLIKSDGFPTYHMAVVVDDHLMEISHVIRAEEWMASVPKHVLLYDMLKWELPIFTHLPLLRTPEKGKISKRKGAVWASWYLQEGYLSEAVLNYLALMAWSHPDQKEIFSREEYIKVFDLKDINPSAPIFDVVKLTWMNGEYIRKMDPAQLSKKLFEFHNGKYSKELIDKTIPLIQERIKTLKEYDEYCNFFVTAPSEYEVDLGKYADVISKTNVALAALQTWSAENIGEAMLKVAVDAGLKNSEYFMVMRVIITGKKISPPLNESMELLGKEECLKRLHPVTVNVNG